jgi:hypothetical protein
MTLIRNGQSRHVRAYNYRGSDGQQHGATALRVEVRDYEVRRQAPGFNGTEQVFALIPREGAGGQVSWERFDLAYAPPQGYRYRSHDEHVAWIDADPQVVRAHGVAFGMETNVGTLWLQEASNNAKPE